MSVTIHINGSEFQATHHIDTQDIDNDFYELVSKRGKKYYTIRNKVKPHLMFCNADGTFSVSHQLSKVWLSDQGGYLHQVS